MIRLFFIAALLLLNNSAVCAQQPPLDGGMSEPKRQLPIFHFQHTDGYSYIVQAEDEKAASFIFDQIRSEANGHLLSKLRGRIISNIFDMFDESPPKRPGLFDHIPSNWWGANTAEPRRQ